MFEYYIISVIASFILMTALIKYNGGNVLVSDIVKNFLASLIPFINLLIILFVLWCLADDAGFMDKKVF